MPEPTSFLAVEDLDATETLVAVEAAVRDRRAVEVRELELVLHWADLHASDPSADARDQGRPVPPGAARLVRIGGAGTPKVQDLSLCELAVARGQHTNSVRALVADGLDLRHRLPELYAAFREGRCELWVVRKVASMTRHLDPAAAAFTGPDRGRRRRAGAAAAIAEAKVMRPTPDRPRPAAAGLRRRYVAVTPPTRTGCGP